MGKDKCIGVYKSSLHKEMGLSKRFGVRTAVTRGIRCRQSWETFSLGGEAAVPAGFHSQLLRYLLCDHVNVLFCLNVKIKM